MSDKPTKYYSDRQEKLVADYLNMDKVPGSGAFSGSPGDVSGNQWLIECKTHTTSPFPIKFSKKVWNKISKEAISKFKFPALITDDGSQSLSNTYVMFSLKYISNLDDYTTQDCSNLIKKSEWITFPCNLLSSQHCIYLLSRTIGVCSLETFKSILYGDT